jgi:hypothetical protein
MQQPLPTILCLSFFPQNAAQDMKISELERKLKAKSDEARNLKVRQAHAMAGLQSSTLAVGDFSKHLQKLHVITIIYKHIYYFHSFSLIYHLAPCMPAQSCHLRSLQPIAAIAPAELQERMEKQMDDTRATREKTQRDCQREVQEPGV